MKKTGWLYRLAVLAAALALALAAVPCTAESPVYEYAYVRTLPDYAIYYLFDLETRTVRQFKTNEASVLVGTFTGDLSTDLVISYHRDWHEHFRLAVPGDEGLAVLTDFSGFSYEYTKADPAAAAAILLSGSYFEIRME